MPICSSFTFFLSLGGKVGMDGWLALFPFFVFLFSSCFSCRNFYYFYYFYFWLWFVMMRFCFFFVLVWRGTLHLNLYLYLYIYLFSYLSIYICISLSPSLYRYIRLAASLLLSSMRRDGVRRRSALRCPGNLSRLFRSSSFYFCRRAGNGAFATATWSGVP